MDPHLDLLFVVLVSVAEEAILGVAFGEDISEFDIS